MYTSGHVWSICLHLFLCLCVYIAYGTLMYTFAYLSLTINWNMKLHVWPQFGPSCFLINHDSCNVPTWCNWRLKTTQILGINCHAYHLHHRKGMTCVSARARCNLMRYNVIKVCSLSLKPRVFGGSNFVLVLVGPNGAKPLRNATGCACFFCRRSPEGPRHGWLTRTPTLAAKLFG